MPKENMKKVDYSRIARNYSKAADLEKNGELYKINAKYHEKNVRPGHTDYHLRRAAADWLKAGDVKKAIRDYNQLSKFYRNEAEESLENSEDSTDKLKKNEFTINPEYRKEQIEFAHSMGIKDHREYTKLAKKYERRAERLERVLSGEWKGLGTKSTIAASIIGLVGGASLLSFSGLTGNVVSNSTAVLSSSVIEKSYVGLLLILIGLACAYAWVRAKHRSQKSSKKLVKKSRK